MDRIIRIVLSIITLIVLCLLIVGMVWGITNGVFIITLTCLLMSFVFGFFTYGDYQYFFGNK